MATPPNIDGTLPQARRGRTAATWSVVEIEPEDADAWEPEATSTAAVLSRIIGIVGIAGIVALASAIAVVIATAYAVRPMLAG